MDTSPANTDLQMMQTLLGNEAESVHIDVVLKVVRSSDPWGRSGGSADKKTSEMLETVAM